MCRVDKRICGDARRGRFMVLTVMSCLCGRGKGGWSGGRLLVAVENSLKHPVP